MTSAVAGAGSPAALIDHLRKSLTRLVPDSENARYGLAVSGGPDSMAMLDLMASLHPGRIAAATLDHGLRPQSAQEAAMVAHWCDARAVPHLVLHPASAPEGNIQAWARGERYARLEEWRTREKLDWLLTAHHSDDQLETMLMRLNRGSGVGGLAAIRARSGHIVRPLLGLRKAELLAHAETADLPFVHDPSNSDPHFDRAALRARLDRVDWLDVSAATRSAAALAQADEALDWTVHELAQRHVYRTEAGWGLDRTDLPEELLRRLVLILMERAGAEITSVRGAAIDHAIAAARAGRQSSIGKWLLIGGSVWTLTMAPPRNHRK